MLGNTYTNGDKGSGFDFELRTLRALDYIAELIAAGGATPGSQNLQQVTTLGNTTDLGLFATDGALIKASNSSGYWQMDALELKHLQGSSQFTQTVTSRELTTNRDLYFPDVDGTIVTSVGGVTADDTGNIPIDVPLVGCYTPVVSDGDSAFTFNEQAGHYYKFGNMLQVYARLQATGTAPTTTSQLLVSLPYTPLSSSKDSLMAYIVFTDGMNQSIVQAPSYESGGFLFFDITTALVPLTNYSAVVQVSYMIDKTLTTCI